MFEGAKGKTLKDGPVILALERVCHHCLRIDGITGAGLMIENCRVQLFLGGVMPEDHSLGDAGCLSNFLGCSSSKTFAGKEAYGYTKDLQAPFVACHSSASGGS